MNSNIQIKLNRLRNKATQSDILFFLTNQENAIDQELYNFAGKIREKYTGNRIHLRGLIEFSNYCSRSCHYCGLHRFNKNLQRYRMSPEEIIATSIQAARSGYRTVVLQSGEDPYFSIQDYVKIIRAIKREVDIKITLAIGEKSFDSYRLLKASGADRYLLKHETSDPDLYRRLNPGMSLEYRLSSLRELKRLGFQVGSGIMLGLPGQSLASIADDLLLFKSLDLDMIGCGPYIPHDHTPLAGQPSGDLTLVQRVLALNRILIPDANIPLTTAQTVLDTAADAIYRQDFFKSANVLMPRLPPIEYQEKYNIYPNKKRYDGNTANYFNGLAKQLKSYGYTVASDYGDRGISA